MAREDLVLYLTGDLPAAERAELEQRLAVDETLRADLGQARELLASVALQLEPMSPSLQVRGRLLARAQGVAVQPSLGRALAWSAAAAAAVVMLGTVATYQILLRPLVSERAALAEERTAFEMRGADQEQELETLEARLESASLAAREAEHRLALLRSPGLIVAELAGRAAQPDAKARIFWDRDDYRCYLHATELEPAADGEQLVLWLFTDDDRVIAAGTLEPDALGEASLFAEMPRDVKRIIRAIVTSESAEIGDRPAGTEQLHWSNDG